MCDTPFKTPLPFRTPRPELDRDFYNGEKMTSDSDESVVSSNSDNAGSAYTQSSNGEISLVAEFDDLMRFYRPFRSSKLQTESAFLDFVEQVKLLYVEYFQALDECRRLQGALDAKTQENTDMEHKLMKARKLLDIEKQCTRNARRERDDLVSCLFLFVYILCFVFLSNRLAKSILFGSSSLRIRAVVTSCQMICDISWHFCTTTMWKVTGICLVTMATTSSALSKKLIQLVKTKCLKWKMFSIFFFILYRFHSLRF
jgi:hypothetical protein